MNFSHLRSVSNDSTKIIRVYFRIIFIFILVLRSIQSYILRLFGFRRRRKKKKSRLLLFEKLGNKKEKKVRYPLVGTKLGFAYAVANRETLALLFLDIHIPPIPIPIFFPSLFFKSYLHECLEEFLMQTSLKIHVFKTIF